MLQTLKRLRVGGIVMVAVLIGASAVISAPALIKLSGGTQNAASAATVLKTRAASCTGINFLPATSGTDYTFYYYARQTRTSSNGAEGFWCHADVPGKATIKSVTFDVEDNSATAHITCAFYRIRLDAVGGGPYNVANVTTTDAGTPGRVLLTTTVIDPVVNPTDTFHSGYAFTCGLRFADVGIYGASVTYTITSGNG